MRMWEPGDPIEGGNDTGIPDIKYFDYLKDKSGNNDYADRNSGEYVDAFKQRRPTFDDILKMADEAFDSGNYSDALKYYGHALNMRYSEEAKYGKAECLQKLGRNDEASQLYFELGDRYTWGDGDRNIAVKFYKKSLECNPNNDKALENLGYALSKLGKYDDALTYYGRVRHGDVDWAMAMCYMELGKYQSAILLLDRVIRECPYCDHHLDEKCECLIKLNRKNEAINLWKQFIEFLMKRECYERALDRLDLLSKNTKNEDDFINYNRDKCLKEKESLEIRFKAILKVMFSYSMYNPNGLDENDFYGFINFVCEESGESVDDIVRWYTTPMLGSSSFKAMCEEYLSYTHWETIVKMYKQGKFRGL